LERPSTSPILTTMSRLLIPLLLLLALAGATAIFLYAPEAQPSQDPAVTEQEQALGAGELDAHGSRPASSEVSAASALQRSEAVGGNAAQRESLQANQAGLVRLTIVNRDGSPADGVEVSVFRQQEEPDWTRVGFGRESVPAEAEQRLIAVGGKLSLELPAATDWRLEARGAYWEHDQLTVAALAVGEMVDLGRWVLQPADHLEGVVRDPQGQAVAGARVILSASGSSILDGGSNLQVAYAESDGRFHFDGLAAGRYRLEARASGYQDGVIEPIAAEATGSDLQVVVPLRSGREVQGVVLNADNRPVAGALISPQRRMVDLLAESGRGTGEKKVPAGAVTSDAQGRFRMAGIGTEPVSLRVAATGYATTSLNEGSVGGELVAHLSSLLAVGGTLFLADGSPAALQELSLLNRDSSAMEFSMMLGQRMDTKTDANGQFRFEGVAPGTWAPSAVHPGGELEEEPLTLATDTTDLHLQMQAASHLLVHVVSNGKPVAGALVRVKPAGQDGSGNVVIEQDFNDGGGQSRRRVVGGEETVKATADAFGFALLPGVAVGSWEVTASAASFAKQTMAIEREEGAQNVEMSLLPASSLRVLVQDVAGSELPGVEVILRPQDAAAGSPEARERSKTSDAGGRAVWTDLNPGRYELAYRPAAAAVGSFVVGMASQGQSENAGHVVGMVELVAGSPFEQLLVVEALASVEVLATRDGNPAAGIEVWLQQDSPEGFFGLGEPAHDAQWTGPDGLVHLNPVEPGAWTLVARSGRDAPKREQQLNLESGIQDAQIEIGGASLRGILLGKDGPLSGAQVTLRKASPPGEEQPPRQTISIMVVDNGDGPAMEIGGGNLGAARAVTAADGSFLLREIPAGDWEVAVKAKGYGDWTSEALSIGDHQERDLGARQMQAEAAIVGVDQAFDMDKLTNPGGFTLLSLEDAEGARKGVTMPQRDGRYRFGGLAPGGYRVVRGDYKSPVLTLAAGEELVHDLPKE